MAARKSAARGRGARTARKSGVETSAGNRKAAAKKPRRKATRKKEGRGAKNAPRELLTLTEVGRLASVSMPTLQKYKKAYADRIPSVGEGRRQRYPRAAVAVLRQLKKENLARRGRPPKSGGRPRAAGSKRAPSAGATSKDLLTLTEISRRTKISYPTVSRYVKLFLDRIPHVGSGRQRRFPPQAVAAFLALRQESRPGRPARAVREQQQPRSTGEASLAARLRRLEQAQVELSRQVGALVKQLKKPLQVTIKGR